MTTETVLPREIESATDHEESLWKGKPKLVPFVLSRYLTGLVLLLLVGAWLFTGRIVPTGYEKTAGLGLWLALFPLGIFFWTLIRRGVVCKQTRYTCSNNSITLKSGFRHLETRRIAFEEIEDVNVTVNNIEKMCGVGTISFYSGNTQLEEGNTIKIYDYWEAVPDPYKVFEKVKLLMLDATINHASPIDTP